MKKFTRKETKSIIIILTILLLVSSLNILASLRRGRDSIRKNDISALQNYLDTYYQKYRSYPLSNEEGEIIGCFDSLVEIDKTTGAPLNAVVCKWGESNFESGNVMPRDPKFEDGTSYLYKSTGVGYKLYIALEGKDEAEYTESIAVMNLSCGNVSCNYGREIK